MGEVCQLTSLTSTLGDSSHVSYRCSHVLSSIFLESDKRQQFPMLLLSCLDAEFHIVVLSLSSQKICMSF